MDELKEKVCVVTGASTGIGKAIAEGLARLGGTVVLAGRNPERVEAAKLDIAARVPGAKLETAKVDVSENGSIAAFAADIARRFARVDVLVNNAGVWNMTRERNSAGVEQTFATNVLGYHLVTRLIAPRIPRGGRVVNVASSMASGLDLDDVNWEKRKWNNMTGYSQTKQADRMLSWKWADELATKGVTVNAYMPGFIRSEFQRNASGFMGLMIGMSARLFGKSTAFGADTGVWLASSKDVEGVSGKLWENRTEKPCTFRDPVAIAKLWELCERMTASGAIRAVA